MGGISCALAIGLSYGLYSSLKNYISGQIAFLQLSGHLQFIPTQIILVLIGFAMGLGALSSYLCVRKINDGWAAAQGSKANKDY